MDNLIYLPGMMCDERMYRAQLKALGGRVVAITEFDTVPKLAAEVLRQAPEQFALVGLSMGGIISMEVFRQAPHRLTGLALLDTNPFAERDEVKALRVQQIEKVQSGLLEQVMQDELKPNYLADPDHQSVLDICMAMALSLGEDVFLRQSMALRDRPDQLNALRQVAVPTLILHGREDRLCPADRHLAMHQAIAGSRYKIIDNAGHLPTMEQPHATTNALATWLQEIQP